MSTAYPHLFSPLQIGGVRLRNRVVHASMSTRYVSGGQVTDRLITYHANRARGGASMLVTEPLNLLPRQTNPQKVRVLDPANRGGLERWAAAVRSWHKRRRTRSSPCAANSYLHQGADRN